MNKNQRRFYGTPRKNDCKLKVSKSKNGCEVEEVLPPKGRRGCLKMSHDKAMTNRCCFVTPDQKDFAQSTEVSVPVEQYQQVLLEQYGFDPIIPETITQLKELKKVLCGGSSKVENSSQYMNNDCKVFVPGFMETTDGSQWQNIDNPDDIDKFLSQGEQARVNYDHLPKNIRISEVPRVKIIAEKFSKYKKKNIELRRLDEKIVCVEYDIFEDSSGGEMTKPVQRMRAFFSVKPVYRDGCDNESTITQLPSGIKTQFQIKDEDLKKLTEKEIEIIDSKLAENKPYVDDLNRVLKRKQIIEAKKKNNSLDLLSLYEMAKTERPPLNSDFSNANMLSKGELQEMKDLILAKCKSSFQSISRKRVKCEDEPTKDNGVISGSIGAMLLREGKKLNGPQ